MRVNFSSTLLFFGVLFFGSRTQITIAAEPKYATIISNFPDQTDAAIDAENRVHVVYGIQKNQQAYYRMFPDKGLPTPAINVNGKTEVTVAHERGPKIALGPEGSVYVVWQSTDGLVCMRSHKVGSEAQFEPIPVLDKEAAIDVPNAGNDDTGHVYVIWVDHRGHLEDPLGAELYLARTDEKGVFGKNTRISDEHFPVCPCCMPEIQCCGNMIYILYRSSKQGIKEMILRRADRRKMEWTTSVISNDNWKFEGCPMSGGRLAASEKTVTATWKSNGRFYLATSNDQGKQFTAPRPIRSVTQLPLPTTDYLFAESGPLAIGTLKPDKNLKLHGRVINIAWHGNEKDEPRLILNSEQ